MLIKSPHVSLLVFSPIPPSLSCAHTSALEYFSNLYSSALHGVVAVNISAVFVSNANILV